MRPEDSRRGMSLRTKLLLTFTTTALAMAALTGLSLWNQRRLTEEVLRRDAELVARGVAAALTHAEYQEGAMTIVDDDLGLLVGSLARERLPATVVDTSGLVVAGKHAGKLLGGAAAAAVLSTVEDGQSRTTMLAGEEMVSAPLVVGRRTRGVLLLPTSSLTAQHPAPGAELPTLAYGALALAVALTAGLLIARRFSGRLGALQAGVEAMAAGERGVRIGDTENDELGRLSKAFNDMAAQLSRSEIELRKRAMHDPLTGLANRTQLVDELDRALGRARRDRELALIILDLDNFKDVNDSFGHPAGDRMLLAVSGLLRSCVRPEDTVSRLGGDEFAVLLQTVRSEHDVLRVAARIQETLQEPIVVEGKEIAARASVGIAWNSSASRSADELIRNADVAMYSAKAQGKNRVEIFEPSMQVAVMERMELRDELRSALERDEFTVVYQPIVELPLGRLIGVEALLRWQHPDRGVISPAEFIDVAEEGGLILPIGSLVLRTACEQLVHWDADPLNPRLGVSVNLSIRQLQQEDLVGEVASLLQETGLAPYRLTLEITESLLVEEVPRVAERLDQLKALGVLLAIDDFGTGYSTLSRLRTFPIDSIKIDRTFVGDLDGSSAQDPLVGAVIAMGHGLGLQVVAEGVETSEQLRFLIDHGCDSAQGYLLGRPVSPQELQEVLAETHLPSETGSEPSEQHAGSAPPAPAPALNDNDGDRAIRKIVADLQQQAAAGPG